MSTTGGRRSGPEIEMPNPLIRSPHGFRPPSKTGRSYGTLAQSCGGILTQNPQASRANSTARIAALLSGVNARVSAPREPRWMARHQQSRSLARARGSRPFFRRPTLAIAPADHQDNQQGGASPILDVPGPLPEEQALRHDVCPSGLIGPAAQ
jgi:hypothetical protein